MTSIASQITSLTVVYSTVYSDADQRKHQSSASLAFVGGIHRGLVNSPHKGPVTRKMFPFDDVIMCLVQRGGVKDVKKSVRVPPNNLNKTTNKPSYKNVTILHISPSENIHTFFYLRIQSTIHSWFMVNVWGRFETKHWPTPVTENYLTKTDFVNRWHLSFSDMWSMWGLPLNIYPSYIQ